VLEDGASERVDAASSNASDVTLDEIASVLTRGECDERDVKAALSALRDMALQEHSGDSASMKLLLSLATGATHATVRKHAVALLANRFHALPWAAEAVVAHAAQAYDVSSPADDTAQLADMRAALYLALATKDGDLLVPLVDWFCRRAGPVARAHAQSLVGAVACALVCATKSFARFVKLYVERVEAQPLVLAGLQGVWHATRPNDAAVKAGTSVSPPLPPVASAVQAVLDALALLMARTPAPGGVAPPPGGANVPPDEPAISRLMAFVLPFVPRVDALQQIGAIASLGEAHLSAALRVFGAERLPGAVKNRYRPVTLTLAQLLIELHRVPAARASLPSVARAISVGVGLCTLDYVSAQSVLETLEQDKPVPSLLLKTLLQIKETYPTFRNLTLASLTRLAKQPTSLWEDKVLWKGFCIACRKLQPHSFGALAELPSLQREQFFLENKEQNMTMMDDFKAFVAAEEARAARPGGSGATDKTYRRALVGVPVAALQPRSCARAAASSEDLLHDAFAVELVPGSEKALAAAEAALGDGKSDVEIAEAAAAKLNEVAPPGRAVMSIRRPSQVRLGTYNLLADQLAKPERFPYCAPELLQWDTRKKKIMAEIHQRHPDILCLQQMEYWDSFFENELHNESMASLYKQRTGTAKDGVAICWSKDRYQLVLEHKIEFNNLAFVNPSNPASRRLLHDSVALIAVLDPVRTRRGIKRTLASVKHGGGGGSAAAADHDDDANIDPTHNLDSRQRLLVASCELCRDARFADVRVMQTKLLLETLEKLVITTKSKDSPGMQVLVCGGFNAEPTSGVYQLLATGELPKEHADFQQFKMFQDVRHRLDLQSAHRSVFEREPEFTAFAPHLTGTVDYIWYSHSQLACIGALQAPERDDVERDTGLPSTSNGSDHVMVMAVFETIV
jgi:CCR4-NOT transcription complex subunit 6